MAVTTLAYRHPSGKAFRYIMVRPNLHTRPHYDLLSWGSEFTTGRYDHTEEFSTPEEAYANATNLARHFRLAGWEGI